MIMLFLLLTSAVASCFRPGPPSDVLRGRLLVWHTWPEPYSGLIEASLKSFSEVNPDVLVVSEYVDCNGSRRARPDCSRLGSRSRSWARRRWSAA
ncbi:MAG: hypothetical protein R3A10_17590 [Caldilineaceae bacterium]